MIVSLSVVTLFVMLIFIFRDAILQYYVEKFSQKYSQRYSVDFYVQNTDFKGFKTIELNEVLLVNSLKSDTIFNVKKISANVSLMKLFKSQIRFSDLSIDTIKLKLIDKKESNNFSFLLKQNKENKKKEIGTINYGETANRLLNVIFDAIPPKLKVTDIEINLSTDSINYQLKSPSTIIENGTIFSTIYFSENQIQAEWQIEGDLDLKGNKAGLKIFRKNKETYLPLIHAFNLKLTTDTLYLNLNETDFSDNQLKLKGTANIVNLEANHWRISQKDVTIQNSYLDYSITIGNNFFQVDSTTTARLNKIIINPYIRFTHTPYDELTLKIEIPKVSSQSFFESLPHGLFTNIDGIKSSGELDYSLFFSMNSNEPDKVQFSSNLKPYKFKILQYGETNFSKINEEFKYTVYEKDRAVRTFLVGHSNPFFTSLDNISPIFLHTIQNSEDGNFYGHKGFNEHRFRESIAINYKKKRFARGASTISMQLIKNVFLRRNKTVARKVEEALIVWLIEQNRLVSKDRMFEVYLNVIEFGPNIYGIGEAANFYFNKTPGQLNLEESIFLSMIVPRPKWFMYQFDTQGKLKENTVGYYNLMGGILLKHGIITEEQKNQLPISYSQLVLSSLAQSYLPKQDTTIDSEELFIEEE